MKLATWLVPWLNKGSRDTEVYSRWVRRQTSAVQKEKIAIEWRYIAYVGKALFMSRVRGQSGQTDWTPWKGNRKPKKDWLKPNSSEFPNTRFVSLWPSHNIMTISTQNETKLGLDLESLEPMNDFSYNQQLLLLSIDNSFFATIFGHLQWLSNFFF